MSSMYRGRSPHVSTVDGTGTAVSAAAPTSCHPIHVHAIVKLGGAALTHKHEYESLRPDVLLHAARSIKQLHTTLATTAAGLCLVHGAGSFGHFDAHTYQVARGGVDCHLAIEGFVRTRRSVTKLNQLVVSALIDAGVPAVGLSPCGTWTTTNRQLHQEDCAAGISAVTALLQAGYVPVLHGDCVLDSSLGMTILSGDTVVRQLAETFRPQYCAFLTDVPGLFTKPPDEPGAALVPEVLVAPDGSWTIQQTTAATAITVAAMDQQGQQQPGLKLSAAAHDTTGGIATKIAEAAGAVLAGCPVVIAQAGTVSGAAAVLLGPAGFAKQQSTTHPATSSTQPHSSGVMLVSTAEQEPSTAAGDTALRHELSRLDTSTAGGGEAYDLSWLECQQLQATVLRMAP